MTTGYVNIESVINEACARLGIVNESGYIVRFTKLIFDAEKIIGTGMSIGVKYYVYEPGCQSFTDSQQLKIPNDLIDSLSIYDVNSDNSEPGQYTVIPRCNYVIRGNLIIFKKQKENPVMLGFNGILLDLNEMPLISYNHHEALVSYLVYMEMTTRYYSKKVPQYMFRDAQIEWRDNIGQARGDDAFPSDAQLRQSGAVYHSVDGLGNDNSSYFPLFYNTKIFYSNGTECTCPHNDPIELLKSYCLADSIQYGFLPIGQSIVNPEDYVAGSLNEVSVSKNTLESGSFNLNVTTPSYLVMIVPFSSGEITSMIDVLGNDIFNGYFTKLDDTTREIYIYVGNQFLTTGDYNLTFKFE